MIYTVGYAIARTGNLFIACGAVASIGGKLKAF